MRIRRFVVLANYPSSIGVKLEGRNLLLKGPIVRLAHSHSCCTPLLEAKRSVW